MATNLGNGDQTFTGVGSTADDVNGGNGNDTLYGGAGNDTLDGGNDNDYIDGGADNDSIKGGTGTDTIYGGTGTDIIDGGNDNDYIDGGADNDKIDGGSGNDTIYGGTGNDTIDGGNGSDLIYGDDGDDSISGGNGTGNDTIYGGNGNDNINGGNGAGTNLIYGDAGNDTIVSGAGNDTLDGGADNDVIRAGDGADLITGGSGNDVIEGDNQADTVLGGADTITGGDGNDTMSGGDAADTFNFSFTVTEGSSGGNESFTAWLVANGHSDLVQDGEVKDVTTHQSDFSTTYTAWLNYLVDKYDLGADLDDDGHIGVELNQNDPEGTPLIEGMTQDELDALFGDRDAVAVLTDSPNDGDATHTRYYSDSFAVESLAITEADGHDKIMDLGSTDVLDFGGITEEQAAALFTYETGDFDGDGSTDDSRIVWEGETDAADGSITFIGVQWADLDAFIADTRMQFDA
jgi:Ca2+-binding RTX toxin-like protein